MGMWSTRCCVGKPESCDLHGNSTTHRFPIQISDCSVHLHIDSLLVQYKIRLLLFSAVWFHLTHIFPPDTIQNQTASIYLAQYGSIYT